ncbi:MAG: diacylglycerol kinase family protein [Reyranellaceae bacterium]
MAVSGLSALVICNPTAGRRRLRRLRLVLDRLRAAGVDIRLQATGARGDAERLACDMAQADLVVAAGGDGTINEVINGLMAARAQGRLVPPLGIVPLGTANVLAREIGLASDPALIVAALLQGGELEFRPGRLRRGEATRHFAMMAGIGFDADVVGRVDLRWKRLLGRAAYGLASAGRFLAYRPQLFRLGIDGVPYQAASVVVSRGRHYAGPFVAAPRASLAAPELHVCLFEQPGRAAVLRYGAALLRNALPRSRAYRVVPARQVEILGDERQIVQADGDIVARLPLLLDVAPQAIRLKVPLVPLSPTGREPG